VLPRGTSVAVAVGVTSNIFELLRWFYIPFEDTDLRAASQGTAWRRLSRPG
jgi:hypothetical protein